MKHIYWVSLIVLIIVIVGFYVRLRPSPSLQIGASIFTVEYALSPQEKERGLGYRSFLKENHGMLFVYDHKEQYAFWMKGMNFPLDFVWIDDREVVDITENVPPLATTDEIPVIRPQKLVDRVLELPAGTIAKEGIHVGDFVRYIN